MAIQCQSPPGRFLEKNIASGMWYDIGDKRALAKTSQALRERTRSPKCQRRQKNTVTPLAESRVSGPSSDNVVAEPNHQRNPPKRDHPKNDPQQPCDGEINRNVNRRRDKNESIGTTNDRKEPKSIGAFSHAFMSSVSTDSTNHLCSAATQVVDLGIRWNLLAPEISGRQLLNAQRAAMDPQVGLPPLPPAVGWNHFNVFGSEYGGIAGGASSE